MHSECVQLFFVFQKQKTASFYKNRSSDIDASNLTVIPEAPRVSGTKYPKSWDWRILEAGETFKGIKKTESNNDIDKAFGSPEVPSKEVEGAKGTFGVIKLYFPTINVETIDNLLLCAYRRAALRRTAKTIWKSR